MTGIASGQAADVNYCQGGPKYVSQFAREGLLTSADDFYERNKDFYSMDYAEKNWKEEDGHYYYIGCWGITVPNIFYNIDIFNKLNLSVPKTIDDLYEINDVLKENGYLSIALGTQVPYYGNHAFTGAILPRFISTDEFNTLLGCWKKGYNGIKWTDPRIIEALKLFKDLIDKEVYAPGMNSMGEDEARALFITQKAAMYSGGCWAAGDALLGSEIKDFQWDSFLFPAVSDQYPITTEYTICDGWVVTKNAKNLDAVNKFLDFTVSKEVQAIIMKEGVGSVRTDFTEEELKLTVNPQSVNIWTRFPEYKHTDDIALWLHEDMSDPYLRMIGEFIAGQLTPENFAQELETMTEETRAKQ